MNVIKFLLYQSRFIIVISVFFILITALAAFINSCVFAGHLLWELITHQWFIKKVEFHFIEVIERFLTAIALLMLATGLYELFVQPLAIATPFKVTSFHELKSNLGNLILLNMVVIFFGDLTEEKDPQALLLEALAIAIISGILIIFSQSHSSRSSSHESSVSGFTLK